ncbi:MAG: OsmC family protein [Carnobacterium sp.]|uniref:OsmC family protein n=1 Tax=Carnobacterium antarcticum TaxID=2126436 RepID=A0ABW4NM53_9LACT|nr:MULTISPECIES: OsmC family protein [unclassified Carnobacterium]ALV20969.1 OsmC/Ohr family protein [Carnobacterium sp. CP1]QQP71123.1 OsmC family protein [Carnobacterium sp. CS13]
MPQSKSLFHAEMVNEHGVDGVAYVKNGGLEVTVSSPITEAAGTNPEELLGLSLSTCLNATIQSLLKARGKNNQSRVEVQVDFMRESSGIGFFFEVVGLAQIKGMALEEADKLVKEAEKRCPVSKLLAGSQTVTIKTVEAAKE